MRLIEKTEELNKEISKLWTEAGVFKGSVLNFYNLKLIRKAKDGILFIGTTTNVLKSERTLKRSIKKADPGLSNHHKHFFSQIRFLARQAGCNSKWAYIDFWLGLKTKHGRKFPAFKKAREKAAANIKFVSEVENLSFDLIKTVIDELKPRCVVACGMASFFISQKIKSSRQAMISSFRFEETGFHLWNGKTPIFFCESIEHSGSGDMCYERLRWHVKKSMEGGSYANANG